MRRIIVVSGVVVFLAAGAAAGGFEPISFTMPEDGYVSMHIRDSNGVVVRQLLSAARYVKGDRSVTWDGLTTPIWNKQGKPVPAGAYTWHAIWHKGIGLRLRGWAFHGPSDPWDAGPTSYWGGDHALPVSVATDDKRVYLGWAGAEAGKALVACDLTDNVVWGASGHFNSAVLVAADRGVVYYVTGVKIRRVDANTGRGVNWPGTNTSDLAVKSIWGDLRGMPGKLAWMEQDALAARDGKLYLSFAKRGIIAVVDAATGGLIKKFRAAAPGKLAVAGKGLLYVVSDGRSVLAVNLNTGRSKVLASGLKDASAIAVDRRGNVYVAVGGWQAQIRVYNRSGRLKGKFGTKGGRVRVGPWDPKRLSNVTGMAVDARGRLWVAECDLPKRFSVWNTRSGKVAGEFFGPTHYGASGGVINPRDPYLMVGEGCEFRLNPKTGRARMLGLVTQDYYHHAARFCGGSNGRLYLAATFNGRVWQEKQDPQIRIWQRLGDAKYALRASIRTDRKANKTFFWADNNGDQEQQRAEVSAMAIALDVGGYNLWSINTNVGEWHILTGEGFYLTRLFQGDPQKQKWPDKAVPGAVMDDCPSGLGGEDFGGSLTQARDGKVYIQAGKLALWNVQVVGFETVKRLVGGPVRAASAGR